MGDEYLIRNRWPRHELFGAPACPLLHRYTLVDLKDRGKLMIHWFVPDATEHDYHDHPRDFTTLVLWGSYRDIRLDGVVDRVRAPTVRRRKAEHAHRTAAGPLGCLTLVLFRRRRRAWGFWQNLRWIPWQDYDARFRCP